MIDADSPQTHIGGSPLERVSGMTLSAVRGQRTLVALAPVIHTHVRERHLGDPDRLGDSGSRRLSGVRLVASRTATPTTIPPTAKLLGMPARRLCTSAMIPKMIRRSGRRTTRRMPRSHHPPGHLVDRRRWEQPRQSHRYDPDAECGQVTGLGHRLVRADQRRLGSGCTRWPSVPDLRAHRLRLLCRREPAQLDTAGAPLGCTDPR